MRSKTRLFAAVALAGASAAQAAVRTEKVEYRHGEVVLEGTLAFDESSKGPRPGVLVVHEWWGHGPYAVRRAEMLAALGYTAFALDMYGKGVLAKDHGEAGRLSGALRSDRKRMRERARSGLAVLKKNPRTDPGRLAAIGYCFGGTTVLELARAGESLAGVVSFHGGLDSPDPEGTKPFKAKVLVLHGADDAWVSPGIPAFQEEMRRAGADWQMVSYGGAVHSFTVREAGEDPTKGMAYNEAADRRSWEAMKAFLSEVLR